MSEEDNENDPWVMYLIVNQDLGMSAGKIGSQTGHAVGMMYEFIARSGNSEADKQYREDFKNWKSEAHRKVVLGATEKEFEKLKTELNYFLVRDAGFTQIPSGSQTVIGVLPMRKSQAPKCIKKLQVLK